MDEFVDGLVGVGPEGKQIVSRLRCGASGAHDGAIVFAQDKDKWTGNSRYQGAGRPDQDGRFKVSGLPPGEYYIIAVDRIEPGQSGDPDFLESVRSRATPLSLSEGETKTVDLRLYSAT